LTSCKRRLRQLTFTTALGRVHEGDIMRIAVITTAVLATALTVGAGSASAAGAKGASFCSGSSKPDGFVIDGDVSTYNNAGEIISRLDGTGVPGLGRAVQTFCNPNLAP
jgi:hypothetical protein